MFKSAAAVASDHGGHHVEYAEPMRLQLGDELHCPDCGRWHPVFAPYADGTPYVQSMLSWLCGRDRYFAGAIGGTTRYPIRRPQSPTSSAT